MRSALEALNAEMQSVSSDLYARAKGSHQQKPTEGSDSASEAGGEPEPGEPEQSAPGGAGKDGVIDADFEMVDDKGKK